MSRPALEVADVFRDFGPAWRLANAGHVSLDQLKVMSAVERCRTAALGGHVARCEDCAHEHIAYNSCRNRHCPKCQGAAAKNWLAARQAELLPVPYFHVVFTLPKPIADIAYQNKAVVYDILFKAGAETLITIAADPKHLGAQIGFTGVLHTWGSTMTHHPHVHWIVPGGGISLDGERWISCRPQFFLHVRVLSRLFRRLFLEKLAAAHHAGRLCVFTDLAYLAEREAFLRYLAPWHDAEWVVYAKPPTAGPEAVLAYLSRYTHRVAISNSRLVALDDNAVTFKWKDYRAPDAKGGRYRQKTMTLPIHEFIHRFLLHVLPKGFHRIRHYGLLANGQRAASLDRARALLAMPGDDQATDPDKPDEPSPHPHPCPKCGGPMVIIETFGPGQNPLRPQARDPPAGKAQAA
jgi:Zn finger protein HypA/HybF involved in hydrogenase expression